MHTNLYNRCKNILILPHKTRKTIYSNSQRNEVKPENYVQHQHIYAQVITWKSEQNTDPEFIRAKINRPLVNNYFGTRLFVYSVIFEIIVI